MFNPLELALLARLVAPLAPVVQGFLFWLIAVTVFAGCASA